MEDTANLNLPYIMPSQAQKHVTHNEALRMLDALVQLSVLDRDRTVPPETPREGDRHIVAADATGDWAGRDGQLAAWQDGGWAYFAPRDGWLAWVADEEGLAAFHDGGWAPVQGGFRNLPLLGINATADATNRLAVASAAVLLDHEGAGHRLKINKAASGETATLLFQSAYQGRAEIGLAGDDDLRIKLSADGEVWTEALRLTAEGRAVLPAALPLTLPGQIVARRDIRERLTADRTYHVRKDGDDGNDGLVDSAGGAFATIQHAIDIVYGTIDIGPHHVTIQLGDGVYSQSLLVNGPHLGSGTVTLAGNAGAPQNTVVQRVAPAGYAISVVNRATLHLRDLELRSTSTTLSVAAGGSIKLGSGLRFAGNSAGVHLLASTHGLIDAVLSDYRVLGNAAFHARARSGSRIDFGSATIDVTGRAFSTVFASADQAATMSFSSASFTGTATGKRYDVALNGIITTNGAGANFLPGDVVGTADTGGQYA